MKTPLLALGGLAAVCLLTYVCGIFYGPAIERDLTSRTELVLALVAPDARIRASGQLVTLTGTVPDDESRQRAGTAARGVWGVEEVQNLLRVASVKPTGSGEEAGPPPDAPPAVSPAPSPAAQQAARDCQTAFDRVLQQSGIPFESDSAALAPASNAVLNRLAAAARGCPEARFDIEGHTDSYGVPEFNLALSKARADAVRDYLKDRGIAADRMTAAGYGSTRPLTNDPKQARKNRRTEFKVKGL